MTIHTSRGKTDISTYSFELTEIDVLRAVLNEKFRVRSNFYKDRDKGYRVYCNTAETQKLIKIITPYIIDSMKYKIGFKTL